MKRLIIIMLLVVCSTAVFAQKKSQSKPAKAKYACTMHPDVTSSKPGKCPKCDSKLVVQRKGSKQTGPIVYTCSMHPDVVSNKEGKCSQCGMELVVKGKEKK